MACSPRLQLLKLLAEAAAAFERTSSCHSSSSFRSSRLLFDGNARRTATTAIRRSTTAVSTSTTSTTKSSTLLPSPTNPLRVAVVGSGPAGCYAASELFKRLGDRVRVDIVDKLPTPFGLVRSGVAPDHQDTKNVTNQFERVLRDERAAFFGGVEVVGEGEERDEASSAAVTAAPRSSSSTPFPISLDQLRKQYHAVVLAHGAESATALGLPLVSRDGKVESSPSPLSGVVTARDFVLWCNGHPELSDLGLDLRETGSVVVVGAGNVALDCARLLLRSKKELLERTDASRRALDASLALGDDDGERSPSGSLFRAVHVVSRRGAAQAAFSAKELREALSLPGVSVFIHHPPPFLPPPGEADGAPSPSTEIDPADRADLAASRRAARVHEILRKKAIEVRGRGKGKGESNESKNKKQLHFHFLRSPVELIAADDGASAPHVSAVRLVANRLETREDSEGKTRRVAVPVVSPHSFDGNEDKIESSSSSFLTLPAQLVIAALGFKTPSLGKGVPYDDRRGVVPSGEGGRVLPLFSSSTSSSSSSFPSSSSSSSDPTPLPIPGLYVTGWARRGPTGIIGENLRDAAEVADAVAVDAATLMTTTTTADEDVTPSLGLAPLLLEGNDNRPLPRVVGVEGWGKIDAAERARAVEEAEERRKRTEKDDGGDESAKEEDAPRSPPRVKIIDAEELFRAAGV